MRAQKPRPGDFSGVWSLLAPRARVLVDDLVRELAQASADRLRVDVAAAIDRAPGLSSEKRAELKTLFALLEDHA